MIFDAQDAVRGYTAHVPKILGLILRDLSSVKSAGDKASRAMSDVFCAVNAERSCFRARFGEEAVDYDAKRNGFKQSGFARLSQAL